MQCAGGIDAFQDIDHVVRRDPQRVQSGHHLCQIGAALHLGQSRVAVLADLGAAAGTTTVSPSAKGFG